ncbi:hypothetical protein VIGAN_09207700, partial [Vigna angularis var. angularis]
PFLQKPKREFNLFTNKPLLPTFITPVLQNISSYFPPNLNPQFSLQFRPVLSFHSQQLAFCSVWSSARLSKVWSLGQVRKPARGQNTICGRINGGSSFIQNKNSVLPEKYPSKTHELALPHTPVFPFITHFEISQN